MNSRSLLGLGAALALAACSSRTTRLSELYEDYTQPRAGDAVVSGQSSFGVLSGDGGLVGSSRPDLGRKGLFAVRDGAACQLAVASNGDESYAARMQALEGARKSIRIQALIFTGDEAGLKIAEILKKKRAQGLDVRVIVDAFSNPSLQTQNMYFDLKQNGVEVEGYEAFLLQWLNEVHPDLEWANMRFHEKMWLIDVGTPRAIGVVGGLNVANEYFRIHPRDPAGRWRDQDLVVRGAVLDDMAAAFDRNFEMFVDIKKSRGILDTNRSWNNTRAVMDATGTKVPFYFARDGELVRRADEMAERPVDLEWSEATCRFLQSRPRYGESYIEQAYLEMIRDAREEVLIGNAYLVPSRKLMGAIEDAARRCVRVLVLTNSPGTNDLPELSIVGRQYYGKILATNESSEVKACGPGKGVQIWEWAGRRRGSGEITDGQLHAKYAVFDRQASLVGSHNLDPRSERLNSETALVFDDPQAAAELARLFYENDLALSRPVTTEMASEFEEPNEALYRLRKTFGSLFEKQL